MRIIFFGTPYYVLPILESLHKAFKERGETPIEAVVTQPPKPAGRKQTLEYSSVDKWAHNKKVPIYFDTQKLVKDSISADIGILASYGAMIPEDVINHFPKGILVIHPSMLPEFRGSSPVPAMLAANSQNIGCSIFKMDSKWDHGPIVSQFSDKILPDDNYQTLRDRLFERSAEVLVQALPAYVSGKIKLKPQDDEKASFARMIKKEDAFIPLKYLGAALQGLPFKDKWKIDFIKTQGGKPFTTHYIPSTIHQFIRAMTPWPGAWTEIKLGSDKVAKRLKILKAHVEKIPFTTHHPLNTKLVLDLVQLEGKNEITWEQFKQGYPNSSFN